MLQLNIPTDCSAYPAAAFTQSGQLLIVGDRETCEQVAYDNAGLYCWIDKGRAVIRQDFENTGE
jgi:hypothetical protein